MKIKVSLERREHLNVGNYSYVEIGISVEGSIQADDPLADDVISATRKLNTLIKKYCKSEREYAQEQIKSGTWPSEG